jgi:hypothetical protein
MRAVEQSRKITNLSKSLHHDLTVYALAAGAAGVSALALAQPCDAEVVVTTVNQIVGRNQHYAIDMARDGVIEFIIQNSFRGSTLRGPIFYFRNRMSLVAAAGAQVWSSGLPGAGFAAALPRGREIGAGDHWEDKSALLESTWGGSSGQYTYGNWFRRQDRYLGLQFRINGEIHYGWARLSMLNFNEGEMKAGISSFAYETQPNKAIRAGQLQDDPATSSKLNSVSVTPEASSDSLGVLALGATGISLWRREQAGAE